MAPSRIIVARHATRRDSVDTAWRQSSPTPYDPPISANGALEADALGRAITAEVAAVLDSIRSSPASTPAGPFSDSSTLLSSSPGLTAASSASSVSSPRLLPSPASFPYPSSTSSSPVPPTRPLNVYIHTSPFLRCAMTASHVADQLTSSLPSVSVKIRIDSFLGEWLTPDYFANSCPPPDDGHSSLAASSTSWLLSHGAQPYLDLAWPLDAFGRSGEYGERWRSMYARFSSGLSNLISSYSGPATADSVVVLVTHGAGSNALVGAISGKPMLTDFGLASLSVAVPHKCGVEVDYSSNYGYGGEKRDRAGYGVLPHDDIGKAVDATNQMIGKWDLTRIADDAHLSLLSDETQPRRDSFPKPDLSAPKFELRTSRGSKSYNLDEYGFYENFV
ncbi:histidine phosphatase superfamily [Myxozyma melibiosi]|uniref:Histidine phosphatase superfamily n=1 Tax=Myxozyma melibiosi TaxID=54550 RepID=A0ABR1FD49_9ASCO